MENIKPNQENIKPNETGLEEVETPLEMAEIEEAQRNLEEIDKLPKEEKVRFMDKLKHKLKKARDILITTSGVTFTVGPAILLGMTMANGELDPNLMHFVKWLPAYIGAGSAALLHGLPALEKRKEEWKEMQEKRHM